VCFFLFFFFVVKFWHLATKENKIGHVDGVQRIFLFIFGENFITNLSFFKGKKNCPIIIFRH
jgi:hypothetical protein